MSEPKKSLVEAIGAMAELGAVFAGEVIFTLFSLQKTIKFCTGQSQSFVDLGSPSPRLLVIQSRDPWQSHAAGVRAGGADG